MLEESTPETRENRLFNKLKIGGKKGALRKYYWDADF